MARWQQAMAFFKGRGYAPLVAFGVDVGPPQPVTITLENPGMTYDDGVWGESPPPAPAPSALPAADVPSAPDEGGWPARWRYDAEDMEGPAPRATPAFHGPGQKTVLVAAGIHRIAIGTAAQDPIVLDRDASRVGLPGYSISVDPVQGTAWAWWADEVIGPESEEFLRALCEIHRRVTGEEMPLAVDMAQLTGPGCAALSNEQARRLWLWRLALAVYVDREGVLLGTPPTLHLLGDDDLHLLLDWHYGRWTAVQVAPNVPPAWTMARDVVTPTWYAQRMKASQPAPQAKTAGQGAAADIGVVPPPTAQGLGANATVCAYTPFGKPWVPAVDTDADRVAQPGSQWLWATAPADIVDAIAGRSGLAVAEVGYDWHTGSLWDTDPLQDLVEAVVALQRFAARAGGFDPDGEASEGGAFPPAPGQQPTVQGVVALSDGEGPALLRGVLATRTRAALLYVAELAQRRASGITTAKPTAADLDHAPTCVDPAGTLGTPSFAAFADSLAGAAEPEMARMQLLLALLRTLNVPARLEIRPRVENNEVILLAPLLPVAGTPTLVETLQLVRSTEPVAVVSGPQLALPTLGRVVQDWTVFTDGQLPYASVRDPLELTAPLAFVQQDRELAGAVAQGQVSVKAMRAQATTGPWAAARIGLTRSLALGLMQYGGVRQQWMWPKVKECWQAWALALQPEVASGLALRQWLHGLFEVRVAQEASGRWRLFEPLVVQGAPAGAWSGWPSYWKKVGEQEWALSLGFAPYGGASLDWWEWEVARVNARNLNAVDLGLPLSDPKSGRIVSSGSVSWLEADVTLATAANVFAARLS